MNGKGMMEYAEDNNNMRNGDGRSQSFHSGRGGPGLLS
jgi:hypothetical protein